MRCVILDDYQDVATSYADWSSLENIQVSSVTTHVDDHDDLVLVVMRERTPLPRALLERLPSLRLVVTSGMRNASIDLAACRELGITVCGTASASTPPAELAWALILGLLRQLVPESQALRRGGWQATVGSDLAGSTLGLLGLGRIRSRVAAVARAFEMDVAAWSPHLTEERVAEAGARLVTKADLFAGSDVVSLHLVLANSTRGIVGRPELEAMRPTAYLVNTSRAGLVDTAAILDALDRSRIAGAGLGVFNQEPLPVDDRLRTHPRVLAPPHLGYVTERNYRTYVTEAVDDVAAWLAGQPVRVLA